MSLVCRSIHLSSGEWSWTLGTSMSTCQWPARSTHTQTSSSKPSRDLAHRHKHAWHMDSWLGQRVRWEIVGSLERLGSLVKWINIQIIYTDPSYVMVYFNTCYTLLTECHISFSLSLVKWRNIKTVYTVLGYLTVYCNIFYILWHRLLKYEDS